MAGKIKPLEKKEQEKEEPKEEKKEEPPKEELESKLEDKEAEEIAAREQPTLPDLEDTVEAAAEAENIPPPQPEEQLHYQPTQPKQQGEEYLARPGEEKVQDPYQPKSQEIPYNTQKEQEKDYRPQHHHETTGEHEAEQILSRKLAKGYHK